MAAARSWWRQAVLLLACAGLALGALTTPSATAADGDASVVQCYIGFAPSYCSYVGGPDVRGGDVVLSADGRQLYDVDFYDGVVKVYDRSTDHLLVPRSGPTSCYARTSFSDVSSCTVVPGSGALTYDVDLSDDDRSLYLASEYSIVVFGRDAATGNLTYVGCYGQESGCTDVPGLGAVESILVSPNGAQVYAHSEGRIMVFDRDAATSGLTLKPGAQGCLDEAGADGCTDGFGLLGRAFAMAMSGDSRFLYLPMSGGGGGVTVFRRADDGTLSQPGGSQGGCISATGASSVPGECAAMSDGPGAVMDSALSTSISPDGRYVFLSGLEGTLVFSRAADTGLLARTDCVSRSARPGCQVSKGGGGFGAAVSPDGRRVVIASTEILGVRLYGLDPATGRLSPVAGAPGCLSGNYAAGCTGVGGGGSGWGTATFRPDGLGFYEHVGWAMIHAAIDAAPTCQPVSGAVTKGAPTQLTLSCTDANGDPLTIQAAKPAHGKLGAIGATGTVVYTPAPGYDGPDTFTYTASARGATSSPATVTMSVQSAPDRSVTLRIRGTRLHVSTQGKAKVRLTCPATEWHGPCTGKLTVRTRGKVSVDGREKKVVLGRGTYSVAAGATKKVVVRLSTVDVTLLREQADARKVLLVAKVRDAVGNRTTIRQKARLTLP